MLRLGTALSSSPACLPHLGKVWVQGASCGTQQAFLCLTAQSNTFLALHSRSQCTHKTCPCAISSPGTAVDPVMDFLLPYSYVPQAALFGQIFSAIQFYLVFLTASEHTDADAACTRSRMPAATQPRSPGSTHFICRSQGLIDNSPISYAAKEPHKKQRQRMQFTDNL